MMESSSEPSDAADRKQGQNRSRTPKAARTQKTPQQNAPSGSDPGHQNQSEPEVKPGRGDQNTTELENPQAATTKRRRHKHRRTKQAAGGAQTGTADHLPHTAPKQQQEKHKHLNTNVHMAMPPLIDDSRAPDDGGGEKQKKKKKKKSSRNTDEKTAKASEPGAVEKPNTPLKNMKTQGKL